MAKIKVKDTEITIFNTNDPYYVSITDMCGSFKDGSGLIRKWITIKIFWNI